MRAAEEGGGRKLITESLTGGWMVVAPEVTAQADRARCRCGFFLSAARCTAAHSLPSWASEPGCAALEAIVLILPRVVCRTVLPVLGTLLALAKCPSICMI